MHAAVILILAALVLVDAQHEQHSPYQFSYSQADPEGGTQDHQASSDSQGRVSGSYTFKLPDGRERTVVYTADESGYRAEVVTNELGTESKNPADVVIHSSAPTGAEAALLAPPAIQASHG